MNSDASTAPETAVGIALANSSPAVDKPARWAPAELSLTLPAVVLRLPYAPGTRLVLAEIVSLHASNRGCCDCSDAHLAARLTISRDTASVAVQLLEKDGLVVKETVRLPTGFYRTLTPVHEAIQAKAETNPYPEFPGRNRANPSKSYPEFPATRNLPPAYPESPATPTRNLPVGLPGNSGSNIPLTTSSIFQEAYKGEAPAPVKPKRKKRKKTFTPPTLAEVRANAAEHFADNADAQSEAAPFIDHYESNGWRVSGKTPMVDWRASFRGWMRRRPQFQAANSHGLSQAAAPARASTAPKPDRP